MSSSSFLGIENVLFTCAMLCYFSAMVLYFIFIAAKNEKFARIAFFVQAGGFAVHTIALVIRGIGAGRLPMTNQYEFATSFAWGLCLVGAFGVSFALGIIYLLRERMEKEAGGSVSSGASPTRSFLDAHIPDAARLDQIAYRSVSLGLLFLTFTIITGAIWAERAWGSYWSWDPKETWSLITWIIYMLYLHMRMRRGLKGRAAAIFAIIGFICVLFTYIGVNTFLPGIHSYA